MKWNENEKMKNAKKWKKWKIPLKIDLKMLFFRQNNIFTSKFIKINKITK